MNKITKLRYKASDFCQLLDKSKYLATTTINGVTFTNNGDGTITANGTCTVDYYSAYIIEDKLKYKTVIGHKYVLLAGNNLATYNPAEAVLMFYPKSDGDLFYIANSEQPKAPFGKVLPEGSYSSYSKVELRIRGGATVENFIFKPQLFDLTEMYGAGNEPTTLAEFRQKYPNDLYPYSPQCWYSINKTRYMSNQYGNIDLSTLTWSKAGLNFASTPLSNVKIPASNVAANMICSKYRSVPINKSFVEGDFAINSLGMLYVRDTKYGDVISFKESLKNLILTYELATNSSGGYLPLNKGVKI